MNKKKTLMVSAALLISLALLQTALVFACSDSGSDTGQGSVNGNGNPGGHCDSTNVPHVSALRPGCKGGPDSGPPPSP